MQEYRTDTDGQTLLRYLCPTVVFSTDVVANADKGTLQENLNSVILILPLCTRIV